MLAIFEQQQGRDGTDAVLGGEVVVGVNVNFHDFQFAVGLCGKRFQFGGNRFARTAPGGPEINEYRDGRADDFALEVGSINSGWVCS